MAKMVWEGNGRPCAYAKIITIAVPAENHAQGPAQQLVLSFVVCVFPSRDKGS